MLLWDIIHKHLLESDPQRLGGPLIQPRHSNTRLQLPDTNSYKPSQTAQQKTQTENERSIFKEIRAALKYFYLSKLLPLKCLIFYTMLSRKTTGREKPI